jgi:hypothetical protein
MVNNVGIILDAGELKYIDHYKMKDKRPIYYVRRYQEEYIDSLELKEEYRLKSILEICEQNLNLEKYCMEYFNITKFENCWMLNISPDWKGNICLDNIKHFKEVIRLFYKNTRRFSYVKYVLECGGEGNFLHCHSVFKLNPDKLGNMKSCYKGNFLKEFRSCWDRLGYKGKVKNRYALQTTLITNKEMLQDKLDYLIEELKPESHKNAVHSILPFVEELGSLD